jgi:hypothetical protein
MDRKKVFFLAQTYLDLYKEIVAELERQQYDVYVFPDKIFHLDPYFRNSSFKLLKKIYSILFISRRRYWRNAIKKIEFNEKYDILFSIDGCSIDKILIDHLKSINPNLKTILYLWDSNNYYNFERNFYLFNKIFTFDRIDSEHLKINHLPIFWINEETNKQAIEYKIFFIGSMHSDRYWLIKKIMKQVAEMKIPYYIKLFVPVPTFFIVRKYITYILFRFKKNLEEWNVIYGKYLPSFVINHQVTTQQFNDVLKKSLCVLDTDKIGQNGLTPRFIWALAANKKIITTNKDIINYPFYSPDRILIIDRETPRIPYEFIMDPIDDTELLEGLLDLRIDNWIKTIFN